MAEEIASQSAEEADLMKEFKEFVMKERLIAEKQRLIAEKARINKAQIDSQAKLLELKKFASSFKLSTPLPKDISFIIGDLAKQEQPRENAPPNTGEHQQARSSAENSATEMEEGDELLSKLDLVSIAGSALGPQDGNNYFHTPNPDYDPFPTTPARTNNRNSLLSTRISIAEMHHGKMVHNEEEWEATLLILNCRFHGGIEQRRYTHASVCVEFFDKGGVHSYAPTVVKMAPDGRHTLDKTEHNQHMRLGLSTGITVPAAVINDSDTRVEWEREHTKERSFEVVVTGTPYHSKGRDGDENAARWTMQEDESAKKGIPSLLQTAVLVKRPSGSRPFEMRLYVDSSFDLFSKANRLVSFASDDDPRIDSVVITPRTEQVADRVVVWISASDRMNMEDIDLGRWFRVRKSNDGDLTSTSGAATRACSGTAGEGATDTNTTAMTTTTTTVATMGISKEGTSEHAQVAAALDGSVGVTFGVKKEELPPTPVAFPPLARVDPAPPSPEAPAATSRDPAMITDIVPASLLADIILFSAKTAEMAANAAQTAAEAAKAAAQAAEAAAKLSQSILQAVEKLPSA